MKIAINFVPETERQKNMIDTTTIPIDPIDAYNKIYGFETFHPLVSVADLSETKQIPNHINFRYGVYSLWLKDGVQCALHYGRTIRLSGRHHRELRTHPHTSTKR